MSGSIRRDRPPSVSGSKRASNPSIDYNFDTTHDPGFVDIHRGFLGDTNDDGTTDLTDLTAVALHWRAQDNLRADGDLNGDGTIDLTDLTEVALHWRAQIGVGSFGEAADSIPGASADFLAAGQARISA